MKKIDYLNYKFSKREWIFYILQALSIIITICYLFYSSILIYPLFLPFIFWFLKEKKRTLVKKRKQVFCLQFRDGIYAVSGALCVGYSIENAWKEAYEDMIKLYGAEEMVTYEFRLINHQINMNIPIEDIIDDLGKRTQLEDIISFSDIFHVSKKTGGDMVQIIKSTAEVIADKAEIEKDIQTILAGKQLEFKAMFGIPFIIILFIKLTTHDYFAPVYGNVLGIVVMTVCLGLYAAAIWIGKKLVEIEV
ncbi:type II secretion system F family protein [Anaerosacchariphilus polymeriproducens]|uniref:Type II secretion system protein GspF domain-containing protein n=1 Tax=Anaerosacchariphilus polymeriproducens TaxID=1812858 RepID=A0A371AZZ9_9FIRM|nr:hypothetical protein [Anaerosacchariphilus polymeriproducens]RDU25072.1 hypothetical protein DWV06_00810 [Anaerosacchariphilus polymeriproducens]